MKYENVEQKEITVKAKIVTHNGDRCSIFWGSECKHLKQTQVDRRRDGSFAGCIYSCSLFSEPIGGKPMRCPACLSAEKDTT